MEFEERTIRIAIDETLCASCETHACIGACQTYGRDILVLVDGEPAVMLEPEDLKRRGNECLACEEACRVRGKGALRIDAPIPGLADYRTVHGTGL